MREKKLKKILFAAGGTGGHLFPAQALADTLQSEHSGIELFFAGAGLGNNAYFSKEKYRFYDIQSMTPFRGGIFKILKSLSILLKGIKESCRLISQEKPELVVGFGSFHAFPLLVAAALKRIPLVLFESNAIPGKVIRLFSKRAAFTGLYFPIAKSYLKGKTIDVEIPTRPMHKPFTKEEALSHLGLSPHLPTVLIFGGSQGAKGINKQIPEVLSLLKERIAFQLIHSTGCEKTAAEVSELCRQLNIPCSVKKFEKQMDVAWLAADIAICRAGAMTLSELLFYEVPGILIPYPAASDQHQLKNALFLEKEAKGAIHIPEAALHPHLLFQTVLSLLDPEKRKEMRRSIRDFKTLQKKESMGTLIEQLLEQL